MIRRIVELAALESQQGRLTLQRVEELIRLMHQAANPGDSGSNFKRFAGAWLDARERAPKNERIAATTLRTYTDAVKTATSILGAKAEGPLRQITTGDMELVQGAMRKGKRAKTANLYFSVVRRILESAVQEEIISRNPAKSVKGFRVGDSVKRVEFSADEVKRLMAHSTSPEWHGLILLAAQTGLRQGDLLELTGDNIVGGRIQRLAGKTSADSNSVLQIPLRKEALAWLEGRTGPLFPTIEAIKPKARPDAFKAIMTAAGVPARIVLAAGDPPVMATRSFHSLRHTFNMWMAEDCHAGPHLLSQPSSVKSLP